MKRPPAELIVAVVLVIIVILVSNIRFGIMTGGSPCHPRAQLVVSPNEATIAVGMHMLSGQLDGLFVKVWPSDSQPPDARISGICYVSGADGIRRVNSDDLTLYTGQSIICYFNSTQANGGVPLAKGETYYYAVYFSKPVPAGQAVTCAFYDVSYVFNAGSYGFTPPPLGKYYVVMGLAFGCYADWKIYSYTTITTS